MFFRKKGSVSILRIMFSSFSESLIKKTQRHTGTITKDPSRLKSGVQKKVDTKLLKFRRQKTKNRKLCNHIGILSENRSDDPGSRASI